MNNSDYTRKTLDKQAVKAAAAGRELEILQSVGGINGELLDGRHYPCPKCGGHDRFSLVDSKAGAVLCRHCFSEGNGDFIAAVMWMHDCTFQESLQMIADYLGINPGGGTSTKRPQAATPSTQPKTKPTPGKALRGSQQGRLVRTIPYEYFSGAGDFHVLVERLEYSDGSKSFRQSHWDVEQGRYITGTKGVIAVPWDAPSFKEATTIYWCEGEKAAVSLGWVMESRKPEICCSCNWGGSKNFPPELVPWFAGKEVVIFADNDQPGRDYANRVATAIRDTAKNVRVVSFPDQSEKYDVADWLTDESEVVQ